MIQFSYKSETVGELIKKPEERSIAVRNLIEKLGGNEKSVGYKTGND